LEDLLRRYASGATGWLFGKRKKVIYAGGSTWDPAVLGYAPSEWVKYLMRYSHPASTIDTRRRNYALLADHLRDRARCLFPELPAHVCPLFFPVLVSEKVGMIEKLSSRGVGSVNLWSESHLACPEALAREVSHLRRELLELPIHQSLSEDDMERVAQEFLAAEPDRRW
jgi:hypothetical protein